MKEILAFANTREELEFLESEMVCEDLISLPLCINLKLGGKGGTILCQESKDSISRSMRGRKHSDETKIKMSKSRKGKCFSIDHKTKISEAKTNKSRYTCKPLMLDGVEYYNVYDATIKTGLSRAVILRRIKSTDPKYANTHYINIP